MDKILVCNLEPNPYRNISKYKLDEEKVVSLMASIDETTFWDNILVRENPNKKGCYQIAYGHHRLEALKRLKIKEVDLPIRELDDSLMVKIMANENLETYAPNPKIINETVEIVKNYLDGELSKYKSWEDIHVPEFRNMKSLFTTNSQFINVKKDGGVGESTIYKFLGKAWKRHRIQEALLEIKGDEESKEIREACETFETQKEARKFRAVVTQNEFKDKIKGKNKKEIAQKFKNQMDKSKDKDEKAAKKAMRIVVENKDETEANMSSIEDELKLFEQRVKSLNSKCYDLQTILNKMGINEIGGIKQLFIRANVSELLLNLKTVMKFFGYTLSNPTMSTPENVIDIKSKKGLKGK